MTNYSLKPKVFALLVVVSGFSLAAQFKSEPTSVNVRAAGQIVDLASLKDNNAVEITALKEECPAGAGTPTGCQQMSDYGAMVFDDQSGDFLLYGGRHGQAVSSSFMKLNLNTQVWEAAFAGTTLANQVISNIDPKCFFKDLNVPINRHVYDMMSVIKNSQGKNEVLLLTDGGLEWSGVSLACAPAHYDPVSKKWSFGTVKLSSFYYYASSSEWDPVSKTVLIHGNGSNASPSRLYAYDPVSRNVSILKWTAEYGYDNNLVYFPPTDTFYLIVRGSPNKLIEIKYDRATPENTTFKEVSDFSGTPYSDPFVTSGWVYDPDNKVIAGGISNGRFFYFDPVNKVWSSVAITKPVGSSAIKYVAFHAINYDAIKKVYVFVDQESKKTWAFRFKKQL